MNKENWPEFPLWWLDQSKRNLEGLQGVASHLHEKTSAGRNSRGEFLGDTNEMEKQIIRNLIALEQRVGVLTDVVQSVLQMVAEDHGRRSHRGELALAWIREKSKKCERKLTESVPYRILAIVGTLVTVITLVYFLIHYAHGLKR